MRDLFQVVFELKKKEIDEAKQQIGRERQVKNLEDLKMSNGLNSELFLAPSE